MFRFVGFPPEINTGDKTGEALSSVIGCTGVNTEELVPREADSFFLNFFAVLLFFCGEFFGIGEDEGELFNESEGGGDVGEGASSVEEDDAAFDPEMLKDGLF